MLKIKSYQKKDGKTYYKFHTYLGLDESGKVVRAGRQGFTTEKEARQVAMKLKSEFQEYGYQKPTYETFKEVFELWFDTVYKRDVRESTSVKTRELFDNHILKEFGHMRVSKISKIQCRAAINKWSKTLSKTKTMKNYCNRVFDFAIDDLDLIKTNPMERIKVPKFKKEKAPVNFYDKEELKSFLECAKEESDPKWYVIFRLLAFSGMRKGELLGLQWKKVNFEDNTLTIDQTLTRGEDNTLIIQDTKTNAGNRVISMDAKTMAVLKEWRTQQRLDFLKLGMNTNKPNQYVFTKYKDNGFIQHANITNAINRIIKKHDLKKVTVHQLRHSHCSLLFESGATIKEVQERLGHSSYEVTLNIYTHVTEQKKDETADRFAQHVGF
ncbi:tyrosine-type recombinase/integrase [Alkalibacterium gilvum]|uniref:tyrosine-type recombinase/integrase n=1 Tax=Alkalibacterium gilvum TaxID=1130080 RepID=UPI003F8EC9CD